MRPPALERQAVPRHVRANGMTMAQALTCWVIEAEGRRGSQTMPLLRTWAGRQQLFLNHSVG